MALFVKFCKRSPVSIYEEEELQGDKNCQLVDHKSTSLIGLPFETLFFKAL